MSPRFEHVKQDRQPRPKVIAFSDFNDRYPHMNPACFYRISKVTKPVCLFLQVTLLGSFQTNSRIQTVKLLAKNMLKILFFIIPIICGETSKPKVDFRMAEKLNLDSF